MKIIKTKEYVGVVFKQTKWDVLLNKTLKGKLDTIFPKGKKGL